MALKSVQKLFPLTKCLRNYSSAAPLLNLNLNEKTGVAVATLQRPPVNSLNFELLSQFAQTLEDLEKNKCRGLILTSGSNSVFSAGLDILEMYQPKPDRFRQFWSSLQQAWINLYGSSFPTVAAINGHSPAGGCLLALSCEYRIMLPSFSIGLNETQLGIVAPDWFIASMRNAIGSRQTELALTTGSLFKAEDALKIGLIDELAASKDEALAKAEKFIQRFAKIPPHARAATKKALRGRDIQELVQSREKEVEILVRTVSAPKIQQSLGLYLEALKKQK